MSPPPSTAPEPEGRARAERAAATAQRALGPRDTTMQALRDARAGDAALVRTPEGVPAFWLVPFVAAGAHSPERACGYAKVGLDGRLAQLSQFGANAADDAAWPAASYFQAVPATLWAEIRARHPSLGPPMLSFDGSPARWAWRIPLGDGSRAAYVLPGGWYEAAASGGQDGVA